MRCIVDPRRYFPREATLAYISRTLSQGLYTRPRGFLKGVMKWLAR